MAVLAQVCTSAVHECPKLLCYYSKPTCEYTFSYVDKCNYRSFTYLSFVHCFTIFPHPSHGSVDTMVMLLWKLHSDQVFFMMLASPQLAGREDYYIKIGTCTLISIVLTLISIVLNFLQ